MKPLTHLRTLLATVALSLIASLAPAADFAYAETTQTMSFRGPAGVPITGLSINLPPASKLFNTAVVTLNMPNLTVTDTCTASSAVITLVGDTPAGVVFGHADVGCDTVVTNSGAKSATIVLRVPLSTTSASAFADWQTTAPSTINTSTFASISAVLVSE